MRFLAPVRFLARIAGGVALFNVLLSIGIVALTEGAWLMVPACLAMFFAGIYATVEMGLASLIIGRARVTGLASGVREAVTGEPTILKGPIVRVSGCVWLFAGSSLVLIMGGLLTALAFDIATGPWPPDPNHLMEPCHPFPPEGACSGTTFCAATSDESRSYQCTDGRWAVIMHGNY